VIAGLRVGIDYRPALINGEGIGRYARELVRGLVEIGADEGLRLFASTWARARFTEAELGIAGSRARSLRWRVPSKWMPRILRASGRGVDDWLGGVELFHHTQPNLLPVRRAVELATIFDCIYLRREGWLDERSAERMERAARQQVARARTIFVPTHYVARDVVARLGARADQVLVTELGCDHAARRPASPGSEAPQFPYVLSVARVDARKNHVRMLAAFESIAASGLPHHWIVAGPRGHGAEAFEAALAKTKLRERVEWREAVPEQELASLYSGARAFLFASLDEGFGLPPLEAMAHGVPVVAADAASLPEVCGDAALLVDPFDVDAMAEALRRVLTEPELASDLVRRGHANARKFTWQECARKTLAGYRSAR
jgi:glycosyltransferase involved in cell wall biosynthesis